MTLLASPGASKTVLITGVNGYIASTLGLALLQQGYTVRGTSRNPAHEAALRNGPYKPYSSSFQYVHVPDITAPGAFDAAVTGVVTIMPLAAPVSAEFKGLDAFMGPAVKSATAILESAIEHAGPQLESVVYMSSSAAVWDFGRSMADPDIEFCEEDWNEYSERTAREIGDENGAWFLWYPASKAAAERAVWKFREDRKPRFSISALCPGFVFGPPAFIPSPLGPSSVSESIRVAVQLFTGDLKKITNGPIGVDPIAGPYVDIREVISMYLWCLAHPRESDQQRYLACVGMTCSQGIADILREAYPERGIPGEGGSDEAFMQEAGGWKEGSCTFSLKKGEEVMGIKFRGFKESLLDMVKVFADAGY